MLIQQVVVVLYSTVMTQWSSFLRKVKYQHSSAEKCGRLEVQKIISIGLWKYFNKYFVLPYLYLNFQVTILIYEYLYIKPNLLYIISMILVSSLYCDDIHCVFLSFVLIFSSLSVESLLFNSCFYLLQLPFNILSVGDLTWIRKFK